MSQIKQAVTNKSGAKVALVPELKTSCLDVFTIHEI